MSSVRQETWKSGAWAGQPHSRVAVSCWAAHAAAEDCHRGNGDSLGAEGATSWPGRTDLVGKASGDSCEAFGSCRTSLQPLPVEGLALEGAFENFGKAGSNWSCLGGVSPLSSAVGFWVHRAPTSRTATRHHCGLKVLWPGSHTPLWRSWLCPW